CIAFRQPYAQDKRVSLFHNYVSQTILQQGMRAADNFFLIAKIPNRCRTTIVLALENTCKCDASGLWHHVSLSSVSSAPCNAARSRRMVRRLTPRLAASWSWVGMTPWAVAWAMRRVKT